ncbi:hypothetical protein [Herminiimonas sp. CN]|uniref:hypothetical protein n=1 Tax=Herminiimonas sp. CN TaxID=1349818 RepID=UPI000473E02A|nr:hypothetical protein [Herminiimonas sp. CN]
MSAAPSLYDKYLSDLTAEFCESVKNSTAHRAAIDSFGLEMSKFNLRPLVVGHRDGDVSLMGIVAEDDYELTALALTQAGYAVGDPVQSDSSLYKNHFKVPVSGLGCVFQLHFSVFIAQE